MVGQRNKNQQQQEGEVDAERKKIELEEQLLNLQEKRLDLEQKRIELELRKLKLASNNRKIKTNKTSRGASSRRSVAKSADEWSDNDDKLISSMHSLRGRNKSQVDGKPSTHSEDESVGSDDEEGAGVAKSSDDDLIAVYDSGHTPVELDSTDATQSDSRESNVKALIREDSTVSHTASSTSQSSADNGGLITSPNTDSASASDSQRKSLIKNLETIGALAQGSPRVEPHSRDRSTSSPTSNERRDSKITKGPRKSESSRDLSKERATRRSSIREDEGKANPPVRERSADTRASTKTAKMSNESRGPVDYDGTSILDITTITVTADASGNRDAPSDNKRTGYFVYTWPDGRQYSGDWLDGKFHGQGTYTWPNGGRYVGAYKNGLKHGSGIYEWADGNKYDGEFKHGKRHGKGLQLNEDGSVFHNGAWKEDEPVL